MQFQVGERIGDYEVLRILGAGGMGAVYQVRNGLSDRIEAMKLLLPNLQADSELTDRFLREIKVQASLTHPNIAGLHTALRHGNQLLMVMEYVDGVSLEKQIESGPLLAADVTRVFTQVLDALDYAHARGVVHRDIKPANIMLTRDGAVKLMDFGIAKLKDRNFTQTGRTMGSLSYMSPEQIRGDKDIDARADIYSLGITLYEAATGQKPFHADSDYSLMAAHLQQQPRAPIEVAPNVPPMLSDIILAAIAKDPLQRFQTADAFRNALRNFARPAAAPVVAATMPLAAAPNPSPQFAKTIPVSAPLPPPSAAARSNRGLYMALGSVLRIGILGFAAYQIPRSATTSAAPQTMTSTVTTDAAPQQTQPPVQESTPVQQTPNVEPTVVTQQQQEPPRKSPPKPAEPVYQQPPTAPAPKPQEAVHVPAAPVQQQQTAPPVQQQTAADTAELDQLRDRLMKLATRVAAVEAKAKRIEAEQRSQGYGMRSDVVSGISRMGLFMDEAEKAINKSSAAAAKAALQKADRETENLERILGII